jgi:hypothetical protein
MHAVAGAGIRVNQTAYDETQTDSLANAAGRLPPDEIPDADSHFRLLVALKDAYPHLSSKEQFRQAFGRQQTTASYSRRHWIWTFERSGTTVWALISTEGVAWEWDSRGDPREAFRIRRDVETALLAGTGVQVPTRADLERRLGRRGR